MAIKRYAMKKHPNIYWYETKRGKRYSVRKQYRNAMGKDDWYSTSGFLNWQDAEQDLRKFETRLFDGSIATAERKQISLNNYFDQMAERKIRMGVWKNSTASTNKTYYNTHFRKSFGSQKIQKITRLQYQHFIDELVLSGSYTKGTLHRVDSLMQQTMNDAEINDVITKNKLRHIVITGGKPAKSQDLTKSDFDLFMKTAKEQLNRYEYAFIKLMTLGQRRGEMMGLRTKSSFTFRRDEVNKKDICGIKFYVARTANEPTGTGLKTESSYRTIWVAGEYVDLIKYAISYSNRILEDHNIEAPEDHFLWLNPKTGKPYHVQYTNTIMRRVSQKSGVTIHPHLLRHYFATKARTEKLPETDVMHWLGHASITMTDSYTRETPEGAMGVFKGISKDI